MKIRNIFIGILAAAGLIITGCQEKDPIQGEPDLTLTPSELTFDTQDAATQTITLTSTRDWKVKGSLPEWVDVSPASGEAKPDGITIEVTVTANDAADRTASVDFTIGTVTKTLSISQKGDGTAAPGGDGTAESPFSVAKAIEFVSAMEADVESTTEYYVSGTICQIKDVSGVQQYGNISYLISDDGNYDKATSFTCHRGLYLNGAKFTSADQIKVGDKVVVCGKVLNYYGNTPEFAQGNKIVTLNGQGGGETPDPGPFTVAPISTILALGEGSAIGDGIGIEGVIISSADLNNLTSQRGAYIQDATGGLQLRFTANHDFKFGDKVKINLSGAKKGAYNKAVQVEVDNSMAVRVSSGETVTPKTVSVADFLANKYEGQYVAVENVQVNIQDLSKTWVVAGAHTSINIDEKNGSKFIVFSSMYSKFGSETVPQGSGTLKGIAARNNDDIQLIFAQNSDYAGLTGARFGNDKLFSVAPAELNVSADAESATFKVNGNVAWTASVTEGDFVNILYGQSGNGEGDVVLEFTKNESEESARTAKITVTTTEDVPTKSYVVTLTQAKKAGAVSGDAVTIILDAAAKPCAEFPEGSTGVTKMTTYTIGEYQWTFSPSAGNKFSWYTDGYILWGKKDGYILLPAVSGKKLTNVTILTGKGASTKVQVGVYNADGSSVVAGGDVMTLAAQNSEFTWEVTGAEAGANCQLRVASAHNAQLQKLTLIYE